VRVWNGFPHKAKFSFSIQKSNEIKKELKVVFKKNCYTFIRLFNFLFAKYEKNALKQKIPWVFTCGIWFAGLRNFGKNKDNILSSEVIVIWIVRRDKYDVCLT
jgi:hypothetical protein